MKKLLLASIVLFFSSGLMAQNQETVFGYSGMTLTGAWGGPSFGLAGIGDENVYLRGGFGGLEFNKSIYIAYAAYWLNEEAELPQYPDQDLDFEYKGLLLGYAFKPHKAIHPKINVLTAGGRVDIEGEDKDRVFVLQPSAGVEINVFKWWHIDVLGGYRFVSGTDLNRLSDQDMSAPYGEIKLRFGISWGWR